jgi:hypothetical protein
MPTYSGLYNNQYNDGQTAIGVGLPTARVVDSSEYNNTLRNQIAIELRGRGHRILGRVLRTLAFGAVGDTATQTYRQIPARPQFDATGYGGLRPPATINDINRATTNTDRDILIDMFDRTSAPTYPGDRSGNGGGGKVSGY